LKEGDKFITNIIKQQKKEEDDLDDFQVVDSNEFDLEEYKEFERKSIEYNSRKSEAEGGISLISPILFTSNYFGESKRPTSSSIVSNVAIKPEEEKSDKKLGSLENKNLFSTVIKGDSESSSEDDDAFEMDGTFYFLEKRRDESNMIVSDEIISPSSKIARSVIDAKPIEKNILQQS